MTSESSHPEWALALMEPIATGLEIAGVAVILLGVLLATAKYLLSFRSGEHKDAYDAYRANLGRGILLGLELLVGADIIATGTAPRSTIRLPPAWPPPALSWATRWPAPARPYSSRAPSPTPRRPLSATATGGMPCFANWVLPW